MNRYIKMLFPSDQTLQESSEKNFKKHLGFVYGNLLITSAFTVFAILHIFSGKYISFCLNLACIIICIVNTFFYKKTGNAYRASVILLLSGITTLSLHNIFKNTTFSSSIIWLPIAAAYCRFTLKKSHAFLGFAYSLGLFLIGHVNREYFHIFLNQGTKEANFLSGFLTLTFAGIVAYVMASVYQSEQNRLIKLIENRQQESHELAESKSALVAVLCHDIANPLCVALVNTKVLVDNSEGFTDIQKRKLLSIKKNCDRINEIIDAVRKMESVNAGKLKIQLSKTSLIEALNSALEVLDLKIKEKKIDICFLPNKEAFSHVDINADFQSLSSQVFQNLLSNAIKFSFEHSKIDICIHPKDEKNVILQIKDYGVGIPKEMQQNLFSNSVPTSRTGTKGEKGTGFGLPLVKLFMDIYKGKISVSSSIDKNNPGTQFQLEFEIYREQNIKESHLISA